MNYPQLPEYDPRPDLWARIEADLDSDEQLDRLVGELPQVEPKADLWATIEEKLDRADQAVKPSRPRQDRPAVRPLWTGIRRLGQRRPVWLATAAVVVLVGIWLFRVSPPMANEQVRLEYAVETTTTPANDAAPLNASAADERAEEFIARQCAEEQLACQRPEVHELRNQLTELNAERARIEQELITFGNDPALVRAQVKIENQRADITKELITLLRS